MDRHICSNVDNVLILCDREKSECESKAVDLLVSQGLGRHTT